MGRHRPGEGMTPVTDLVAVPRRDDQDIEWPKGATEEYADELHEMNADPVVRPEVRA
jgi:hypothetical protein